MKIEITPPNKGKYFECSKCGNSGFDEDREVSRVNNEDLCKKCYDEEGICYFCEHKKDIYPVDDHGKTILVCKECHYKYFY